MGKYSLLEFIFKVKVILEDKSEKVVGTAFIIDGKYAITAQHVVEECKKGNMILESYDGKHIIRECLEECALKVEEKGIDIAVIRYKYNGLVYTKLLKLSNDEVNLFDNYETYGYPKYNNFNEFYISGEVISPEGRMSIKNSTGYHGNISLYKGVSGAPLIINNTIRGVIISENVTSCITKPELNACEFYILINYLNSNDEDENNKKLLMILTEFCKKTKDKIKNKIIDPFFELYDIEYKNIKNKKNLSEKVTSKCSCFPKNILSSWNRKCVQARIELDNISSDEKKAILMVVFFSCIEFIEEKLSISDISSPKELIKNIEVLKKQTIKYVKERMKDYSYGIDNMIIFENTIFNLIDSCFLAFDSYDKEDEDVLQ